jgi:hypothetical protein
MRNQSLEKHLNTHQIAMHIPWLPIFIGGGVLVLSTLLLYLTAGVHGLRVFGYDSASYMSGAINLVHGHGLSLKAYNLTTDTITWQPITHYPPLTSLVYAGWLLVGIPLQQVPFVTSLCCWLAFLSGIGVLTYRLSGSWWGAATGMVIAALTSNYLLVFQMVLSEPVFLPLLVWSVVLLVDVPAQGTVPLWRMATIVLLLALLILARFVGSVLFAAIILWWIWQRYRQQPLRRLAGEVVLLSSAFLPMALWLLRNALFAQEKVGSHLQASKDSFWDGISGLLNQLSLLILPARDPLPELALLQQEDWGNLNPWLPWLHFGVQLAILGILVILGRRLWRLARGQPQPSRILPASPILPIVAAFVALYVLLQPLVSFRPMDYRDATTLLCLLQPYLIALLIRLLQRRTRTLLALVYISINLLLMLIPVVLYGIPGIISFSPLQVNDLSGEVEKIAYYNRQGIPDWLVLKHFRTGFVEKHHPQVWPLLRQAETETVIISSMTHMLFYDEQRNYLPANLFSMQENYKEIADWLQHGQCHSQYATSILIDTSLYAQYLDGIKAETAQKCPELQPVVLDDLLVYRLPQP